MAAIPTSRSSTAIGRAGAIAAVMALVLLAALVTLAATAPAARAECNTITNCLKDQVDDQLSQGEPDTRIDSGPSGTVASSAATFEFTSSLWFSTFECRLDGTTWEACVSPWSYSGLPDGERTFEVRAVNVHGEPDPTPASRTWTVETTPPETSVDSGPPSLTNSTAASISFASSEPGSSFECKLDSGGWGGCTSPVDYTGLTAKTHAFQVRATDPVGNVDPTPASHVWRIDTLAPETAVLSGPPSASSTPDATLDLWASEGDATLECRLDSSAWGECGSPADYQDLDDGAYLFEVRSTDPAGNVDPTPDAYEWAVDTTPPETQVDSGPPSLTNSVDADFVASASEGDSALECRLDGGEWTACVSPKTYRSLAHGEHSFGVRATDAAGNLDASPASHTWTVDAAAPGTQIDAAPPAYTNATTADFSLSASEPGSSFECKLDEGVWSPCSQTPTYSGLAEQAHSFRARSTDPAGNVDSIQAAHDWRVDLTPPQSDIVSDVPPITDSRDASFTPTSSQPNSTFECRLDGGAWESCGDPAEYHDLPDGAHTFETRATDPAGNLDATPASRQWTVDTTGPETEIASAPPEFSSTRTASFELGSSQPGSTYECRLDSGAWESCGDSKGYADLDEGAHTFEARATDAASNLDPTPARHLWSIDVTTPQSGVQGHSTSEGPGLPSGWVDDEQISTVATAQDAGTGVREWRITAPQTGEPSSLTLTRTTSCLGDLADPCPSGASFHPSDLQGATGDEFSYWTGKMPEGKNVTVATEAVDLAGNVSAKTGWQLKVDHTAPQLALSGSLTELNGEILTDRTKKLVVAASDPPAASATGSSGVRSVAILVDGDTVFASRYEADCSGCEIELNHAFDPTDYEEGTHVVEVVATDGADLETVSYLEVTVGSNADEAERQTATADPDAVAASEPVVTDEGETLQPSLGDPDAVSYPVTGSAVDSDIAIDAATGVTLPTESGDLNFAPTDTDPDAEPGVPVTSGDAVIYPGTEQAPNGEQVAHAVVHPEPDGIETYVTMADERAPDSYTFDVDIANVNEQLEMTPEGTIEVIDPNPPPADPAPVTQGGDAEEPQPPAEEPSADDLADFQASGEVAEGVELSDPDATSDAEAAAAAAGVTQSAPADAEPDETNPEEVPPFDASEDVDCADPANEADPDCEVPADAPAESDDTTAIEQAGDTASADVNATAASELDATEAEVATDDDVLATAEAQEDQEALVEPFVVAEISAPQSLDATGQELPTTLSVEGDTVTLSVDTTDATYPVVADPRIKTRRKRVRWRQAPKVRAEPRIKRHKPKWVSLGKHFTSRIVSRTPPTRKFDWGARFPRWKGWRQVKVGGRWLAMTRKRYGPVYAIGWRPRLQKQRVLRKTRYAPKVISDPKVNYAKRALRFGYNDDFQHPVQLSPELSLDDRYRAMIRAADRGGSTVIRLAVNWCLIASTPNPGALDPGTEPPLAPGGWDWSHYAQFFNALRNYNANDGNAGFDIKVIAILVGAPTWAHSGDIAPGECFKDVDGDGKEDDIAAYPPDEASLDHWKVFVNEFMARFAAEVDALEVWNEPNHPKFWGSAERADSFSDGWDPSLFAKLVRATYQAVGDKVDIVSGGIYPGTAAGEFLEKALKNNPGIPRTAIDGIGLHLYGNRARTADHAIDRSSGRATGIIPSTWDDFFEARQGAGFLDTKVWITEVGFPLRSGGRDNERSEAQVASLTPPTPWRQRTVMRRLYLEYANRPQVHAFIVHRLVDDPENENRLFGAGNFGRDDQGNALDPDQYGPRPAYCSLAAFNRQRGLPSGC